MTGEDTTIYAIWQYLTIKYDSDGNQLWTKDYYGPSASSIATAVAVDNTDNIYITGGDGSYATFKLSPNADFLVPTQLSVPSVVARIGQLTVLQAKLQHGSDGLWLHNIDFKLNGVTLGTSMTNGTGDAYYYLVADETLPLGNNTIEADFAGNDAYSAAVAVGTLNILKGNTALSMFPRAGRIGQTVTLIARLRAANAFIVGRTLTFSVAGNAAGAGATDGNGFASISYTIPDNTALGSQMIGVSFAGDADYAASSATGTLTISAADTLLTVAPANGLIGRSALLRAQLRRVPDGAFLSGKTLTFVVAGQQAGTGTTDAKGTATFSYVLPTSLATGSQTINVVFAGDTGLHTGSGTATLTVQYATLVTVANLSGKAGQQMLLRALLRRYPDGIRIAGKTLTFLLDGSSVGTAATASDGLASLNYVLPTDLSAGSHTLTVKFAGDADGTASSGTGTLTVTQ